MARCESAVCSHRLENALSFLGPIRYEFNQQINNLKEELSRAVSDMRLRLISELNATFVERSEAMRNLGAEFWLANDHPPREMLSLEYDMERIEKEIRIVIERIQSISSQEKESKALETSRSDLNSSAESTQASHSLLDASVVVPRPVPRLSQNSRLGVCRGSQLEVIDASTRQWSSFLLQIDYLNPSVCFLDSDTCALTGGTIGALGLRSSFLFTLTTQRRLELESMIFAKWNHPSITVDGAIYTFGGAEVPDAIESYSRVLSRNSGAWIAPTRLIIPLSFAHATSLNQTIYVFGNSECIQKYEIRNSFVSVMALVLPRSKATLGVALDHRKCLILRDGAVLQWVAGSDVAIVREEMSVLLGDNPSKCAGVVMDKCAYFLLSTSRELKLLKIEGGSGEISSQVQFAVNTSRLSDV